MFSESFIKKLEKAVEKLEEASSVELVVVVSPVSGNYREIDRQNGFAASILMLLVAIYSPWEFAPEMLVLWLVLAYGAGMLVTPSLPALRRLFASRARRRQQAEVYARNFFVQKRLANTRDRTGLLLYLSYFERIGILVPDIGIQAKVPRAHLNEVEARWAQCKDPQELEKAVLDELERLVEPLGKALPRPEDDENELPNEICLVTGGLK